MTLTSKKQLAEARATRKAEREAQLRSREVERQQLHQMSAEEKFKYAFYSALSTLINDTSRHIGLDRTLDMILEVHQEWSKQLSEVKLQTLTGAEQKED